MNDDEPLQGHSRIIRAGQPTSEHALAVWGGEGDLDEEELAPFDEAFHEKAVAAALAGLAEEDEAVTDEGDLWHDLTADSASLVPPAERPAVAALVVGLGVERERDAVSQDRPRIGRHAPLSARRRWTLAPLLVFAVALVLAVIGWQPTGAPPLEDYALSVVSAPQIARDEPGTLILSPGASFTLLARPADHVDGEVEAALWLVRGEDWTRLAARVEVADGGTVRIDGEYPGPEIDGVAEIAVIVSRPGLVPRDGQQAREMVGGGAIRVLRMAVRPRPAP
jgi:hypothetical protein